MVNEVLKVKLNVPEFIKGKDGKDYVITEADYMAIADVAKDLVDVSDIGGGIKEAEFETLEELIAMESGVYSISEPKYFEILDAGTYEHGYFTLQGLVIVKQNESIFDVGTLRTFGWTEVYDGYDEETEESIYKNVISFQAMNLPVGNGITNMSGRISVNDWYIQNLSPLKTTGSVENFKYGEDSEQEGLWFCVEEGGAIGHTFPSGLYNVTTNIDGRKVINIATGEGFIGRWTEDGYQGTYIPPSTGGELDYDTITAEVLSRIPNGEEVGY